MACDGERDVEGELVSEAVEACEADGDDVATAETVSVADALRFCDGDAAWVGDSLAR